MSYSSRLVQKSTRIARGARKALCSVFRKKSIPVEAVEALKPNVPLFTLPYNQKSRAARKMKKVDVKAIPPLSSDPSSLFPVSMDIDPVPQFISPFPSDLSLLPVPMDVDITPNTSECNNVTMADEYSYPPPVYPQTNEFLDNLFLSSTEKLWLELFGPEPDEL
ncbi:hypothetical protein BDQ17DRAFT_1542085 [Cyathus striatus]|nr:hypothetical protein BDQ17DRAFT_1542085 [Cyathus striatus]